MGPVALIVGVHISEGSWEQQEKLGVCLEALQTSVQPRLSAKSRDNSAWEVQQEKFLAAGSLQEG